MRKRLGRLLSVTNAVEAGTWRQGERLGIGWAPWRGGGVTSPLPMHPCPSPPSPARHTPTVQTHSGMSAISMRSRPPRRCASTALSNDVIPSYRRLADHRFHGQECRLICAQISRSRMSPDLRTVERTRARGQHIVPVPGHAQGRGCLRTTPSYRCCPAFARACARAGGGG